MWDSGVAGGGGAESLDDLDDVTVTSPAAGSATVYDGSGWVDGNPMALQFSAVADAGAVAETLSRREVLSNIALLVSGRISAVAVGLPKGLTVSSIAWLTSATGAVNPTNQWFFIADSSRNVLRFTNDDLTTAWANGTRKTLNLTTPYVTTYEGLYYVGIMVAAATVPTFRGNGTASAAANAIAPIISGIADTGQTTVPALPFAFAALSAVAEVPRAVLL